MNKIVLISTKKDHYRLLLNDVDVMGEQERSFFSHILEVIHNGIQS